MHRLLLWLLLQPLVFILRIWRRFYPPDRTAEEAAVPSEEYPLAGFWKEDEADAWGLAIAPAGDGYYSISFCGPGGCFKPGTYRPNSKIVGDGAYRVINDICIEVAGRDGFARYKRAVSRLGHWTGTS